MERDRKNPAYIETNPDGGAQTIALWCYEEAEAEVDRLTDKLKLIDHELPYYHAALKASEEANQAAQADEGAAP